MEEDSLNLLNLPNEILQKIMKKLPYKDLKNALLVCSKLRDISEHPTLWNKLNLKIGNFSFTGLDSVDSIFKLGRLQNLRYLTVFGHHLNDSQIQNIMQNLR